MTKPLDPALPPGENHRFIIWLAALVAVAFVGATIYHYSFYLRLPVDILGFEESDYLTDLIKFRNGIPIYTDPTDNNSSVYTPGAQLLTYGIARLLGLVSVPGMRVIQYAHLALAALVAAAATHLFARRFLAEHEYRHRAAWVALWTPLLFLAMTEDRFNFNVHTLHPDTLTLLFTASAAWLMARYVHRPSRPVMAAMAVLPALAFWSKQSNLIWGPIFGLLLLVVPRWSFRRAVGFGLVAAAAGAASIVVLRLFGGPHAFYMVFEVLGSKEVSLARSAFSLVSAGGFVALTLAGFVLLARPRPSRELVITWGIAFALILVQAYTTGIGWLKNHLGPGLLLGTIFFCAALPRIWTDLARWTPATPLWRGAVLAGVLGVWGGLDLVRSPVNTVPPDVYRYIAEIEREFEGMDPARTLLDRGTWVYWPSGTVMKDRATGVQLHTGRNQPEVNREMLAATIDRISSRAYDRILMHYPAEGGTYDYRHRGSGVGDALREHYREVRRIRGVTVDKWFPRGLLAEVAVFEPRPTTGAGSE